VNLQKQFERLIETVKAYSPSMNTDLIAKAYELAYKVHDGQMRASGEPYIIHPLAVAQILAESEMDSESIVAALLHDVIEDTNVTYQNIKAQFGASVADLVDGVTKLGRIPYSSREEQQMENLRKMFFAMAKDVRVILIKLADRLHNMRTIENLPEQKRREKALETMEVYSPLTHRLGMAKIKVELEDISIRCLDPIGYQEIVNTTANLIRENEGVVETIKERVSTRLKEQQIKCAIEGRTKHIYSIYRKVYGQNRTFDEVYDLFAVRIIVDSVIDCYNVLGIIHDMYRPIPGRFKDYISTPKPNMYQSLHTTVIDKEGLIFEVQIRTWEMHKTAEYGIAAHWKYKAGGGANDQDAKLAWIRQLLEIQKDTNDPEDFMRALKIDMFSDEVFVFTPNGDVINLSLGSTIIDFAYSIHSEVGNHMQGAKVNGRIVTLDYVLQNGDVVEIMTSGAGNGPNLDWLKICKTSQARNKIRQWFKKEKREENIERGKIDIEKELRKSGLTMAQFERKEILEPVLKKAHVNSLEELYAVIGYGGIPLHTIMNRVTFELKRLAEDLKEKDPDEIVRQVAAQARRTKKDSSGVIIEGVDNVLIKFARCCNPLPGDDIIGFITKGYGVSVHKKDCVNVISGMAKEDEISRWIPVRWSDNTKSTFVSILQITATNRPNLLADVVNTVSNTHIPMHSLNAREADNNFVVITLSVEVQNLEQLSGIINKLTKINAVIDVARGTQ
jgi:GTP pyrophosphokinase